MRTYLDSYILPGTHTGAQILWLYLVQWRRDFGGAAALTFAFILSHCGYAALARIRPDAAAAGKQPAEQGGPEMCA